MRTDSLLCQMTLPPAPRRAPCLPGLGLGTWLRISVSSAGHSLCPRARPAPWRPPGGPSHSGTVSCVPLGPEGVNGSPSSLACGSLSTSCPRIRDPSSDRPRSRSCSVPPSPRAVPGFASSRACKEGVRDGHALLGPRLSEDAFSSTLAGPTAGRLRVSPVCNSAHLGVPVCLQVCSPPSPKHWGPLSLDFKLSLHPEFENTIGACRSAIATTTLHNKSPPNSLLYNDELFWAHASAGWPDLVDGRWVWLRSAPGLSSAHVCPVRLSPGIGGGPRHILVGVAEVHGASSTRGVPFRLLCLAC